MGGLPVLDYKVFLALNTLAGKNAALDFLVVLLAQYAAYFLAAGFVVAWFANRKINFRKQFLTALASLVLARGIVTETIRLLFPRLRPFLAHHVTLLIPKDLAASFPSGHATAFFAIAMSFYFYNKKLGAWLLVLAALVSVARVIAGVHYPGDILAGAVVGIVSAWLVEKFLASKIGKITPKVSEISNKLLSLS